MTSPKSTYEQNPDPQTSVVKEGDIEDAFIQKLVSLKYSHRPALKAHKKGLMQQLFPNPELSKA